jgi:hypothetical protein
VRGAGSQVQLIPAAYGGRLVQPASRSRLETELEELRAIVTDRELKPAAKAAAALRRTLSAARVTTGAT